MAEDALSKIKKIACAAQLAGVLEASSEKPGNVTPAHDYEDTAYADFLAGAIALGPVIEEAASRGRLAALGEIELDGIGIGELILRGVTDVKASHPGGNTHLGTLMLFVPLAAAAGGCLAAGGRFQRLRTTVIKTVKASTLKDSHDLYAAIERSKAGGLGKIIRKDIPFCELMGVSAKRDRVAEELSNGMPIVFKCGLPFFEGCMDDNPLLRGLGMRAAIIQTYLLILSRYPDTFIAKKAGAKKAGEVSNKAKDALDGKISIEKFDEYLRSKDNSLNPGTTADLVAAVLFLYLLKNNVF